MMYPKPGKKKRKYTHISNPEPTENDKCIVCGRLYAVTHEVFFGDEYLRAMSIKHKAQEKLCNIEHHIYGPKAVHRNREFDLKLKAKHQKRIMQEFKYTEMEFINVFKGNYL